MDLKEAGLRIVVALDGLELARCAKIVSVLRTRPYCYKIHDLWDREGPKVVGHLREACGDDNALIWVDLKLKDIPNTTALRSRAVRTALANILTVHASGGVEMMRSAVEAFTLGAYPIQAVFAVTVLTSLTEEEVQLLHGQSPRASVLYQARLAKLAGVDGIVCSPQEVGILAQRPELKGMEFVVPGIRSAGAEAADQKRVDTPAAAIRAGATRLVIGRPITQASDPAAAFEAIASEIAAAMEERRWM